MLEGDVDKLFSEKDAKSVKVLVSDKDSARAVANQIGQRMIDFGGVLGSSMQKQLECMLSTAKFEFDEEEPIEVARMVVDYMKRQDLPIYLLNYHDAGKHLELADMCKKCEIAEMCFISRGFFYSRMQRRHERGGAPHPDFYLGIEKYFFKETYRREIAENIERWENFIWENFPERHITPDPEGVSIAVVVKSREKFIYPQN